MIHVPMFDLAGPVQFVKGVGPLRAEALAKAGVHTVEDLLHHLPLRYEDRRQFARIADLRPGMKIAVAGTIAVAGLRRARRMALYEIRLDDGAGRLKALWFNQPFLKDTLPKGRRVVLFGAVERDSYGGAGLMMASPQWELVEDEDAPGVHTGRIVPVYERLGPLSGKALRRVLTLLARDVPGDLDDPMPADLRARLRVVGRGEALRRLHLPGPDEDVALLNAARGAAHRRLILEELFLFQLGLALRRRGVRQGARGSPSR